VWSGGEKLALGIVLVGGAILGVIDYGLRKTVLPPGGATVTTKLLVQGAETQVGADAAEAAIALL
jgi:hypothetical protein